MNIVEPIRKKTDLRKIEKILSNKSQRDLLIFTIGINCGLRISDILALNVEDVKGKLYIRIVERKTHKFKKIPINSKLKPMLEEYTKNRALNEPLFKSVFNNRLERTMVYKIIKQVCKQAGLHLNVGTHTLRKTFGYHHYKKFKDLALLQKILNHSSPQITLRYIGIEQDLIDKSYNNFVL